MEQYKDRKNRDIRERGESHVGREESGERKITSETAESERKRKKDILIHTIEGGYRLQRRNKLKNG